MNTPRRSSLSCFLIWLALLGGLATPVMGGSAEPVQFLFVRFLDAQEEQAQPLEGRDSVLAGGRVAFIARDTAGISGLYLWDGSTIRTIVDTTMIAPDGVTPFVGLTSIAMDAGVIAFQAEVPSLIDPGTTDGAVYMNRLGAIEPILRPGDTLDGDLVRSAEITPAGLEGDLLGLLVHFSSPGDSPSALYLALIAAAGHDLMAKDLRHISPGKAGLQSGSGGPKIDSDNCSPELTPWCNERFEVKIKNNGDHTETNVAFELTASSQGPVVIGPSCFGNIASLEPGQTVTELCIVGVDDPPGCFDLTLTVFHDSSEPDEDPTNNSITKTFKYDVNQCSP